MKRELRGSMENRVGSVGLTDRLIIKATHVIFNATLGFPVGSQTVGPLVQKQSRLTST